MERLNAHFEEVACPQCGGSWVRMRPDIAMELQHSNDPHECNPPPPPPLTQDEGGGVPLHPRTPTLSGSAVALPSGRGPVDDGEGEVIRGRVPFMPVDAERLAWEMRRPRGLSRRGMA